MANLDFVLEQQINALGGTAQSRIPQPLSDPPLVISQQYRQNGSMTLSTALFRDDNSPSSVLVSMDQMPSLFHQKFDASESNFSTTNRFDLTTHIVNPPPYLFVPNIAIYIGSLILGAEMETRYVEAILIGCATYLDGKTEILPDGTFRMLNVIRIGTNRRYSNLCKFIYYAITSHYYDSMIGHTEMIQTYQELMQDIYRDDDLTSVYTRLKYFRSRGVDFSVTRTDIGRWAKSVPWHALMYNNQAPLNHDQYLDLFFKVFSICNGQELRFNAIHSNAQHPQTIMPNSPLFSVLTPENMENSVTHKGTETTRQFIAFMRYMIASELITFRWTTEMTSNDVNDDSIDDDDLDGSPSAEAIDESSLAT